MWRFAIFTQGRKALFSFTHEQNIICSQTKLDDIAHQQTIISRQLKAVTCRSRRRLSANEKEAKFASNDNEIIFVKTKNKHKKRKRNW